MLAIDDPLALQAALLAVLIDADDFLEIGTVMAAVTRVIDPESRSRPNLALQEALKSNLSALEKRDVITIKDVDEIIDNHVVFDAKIDRDDVISFTDAYLASLGPNYPIFIDANGSVVAEVAAELGLTLGDEISGRLRPADEVPASDRWVSLDHNAPLVREIVSDLEELEAALRTSNEAGHLFGENREGVIAEVAALRRLWSSAVVRVGPTLAMAKSTLGWIAKVAAEAVVGGLALAVLGKITGILG